MRIGPGEIVMLASGGPTMVIEGFEVSNEDTLVKTVWMNENGEVRRNTFPVWALSYVGRLHEEADARDDDEEL